MAKEFRLTRDELVEVTGYVQPKFPKYVTQILNLANRNAGGTRPRIVGQMSELVRECPEKTLEGWKEWYQEKMPNAIQDATDRVFKMVGSLRSAAEGIDKRMVREWVEDLVFAKTFLGLKFQEPILKKLASMAGRPSDFRFANPEEEALGIDGFVAGVPVSIKPSTYKLKPDLLEKIHAEIVYYEKHDDGSIIVYPPDLSRFTKAP